MLTIGDRVQLCGNPWDEQIPEEEMMFIFLASQTMTVTRVAKPGDLFAPYTEVPTPGQHWVKTDMIPDWTDASWFKKAE